MKQKVEDIIGINLVLRDENDRRSIVQVGTSGPPVTPDAIVQEDGFSFLLEDGSGHILQQT